MIRGDENYNKHFRAMVLEAVACGLGHPCEWICGYERAIGQPDSMINEIEQFCDLVMIELCETDTCCSGVTKEEALVWYHKFHN